MWESYSQNMIVDDVQRASKPEEIAGVTQIMYSVGEAGQRRFNDWFEKFPFLPTPDNPNFVRPQLQLSIAGYDFEQKHRECKVWLVIIISLLIYTTLVLWSWACSIRSTLIE